MNLYDDFADFISKAAVEIAQDKQLDQPIDTARVVVEPPREAGHGDLSSNAAMVLSKVFKMKPRDLAELLKERLEKHPDITEIEIAGPGFLNLTLNYAFWQRELKNILKNKENYGKQNIGQNEKINVEFVSANPTGPLHIGHCRAAVMGDVICNLLRFAGYDVEREYYINDGGAQVDVLARSAHLRYREALGEDIGEIPAGYYPGDYLMAVGQVLAKQHGDKWLNQPEEVWLAEIREFAIEAMMVLIREDLKLLKIKHTHFASERDLEVSGAVDEAFKRLQAKDLVYEGILEAPKGKKTEEWEARTQQLFRSTNFGDDIDRAFQKADGTWTYFARDISYHYDKYERGYKRQINILGEDHIGYVKRIKTAVESLADDLDLNVLITQIVNVLRDGKTVKMSKRAGTMEYVRDLVEEVGSDVVRFTLLTRRHDMVLDFDLTKVTEQSRENPVFYVQYAYARASSVIRHSQQVFPDLEQKLKDIDLSALEDDAELNLIKVMANWPRQLKQAALSREPHRIAYYLLDLAAAFHSLWNKGREDATLRFILEDQPELTLARLAMIKGFNSVLGLGLKLMGVTPAEEM